VPPEQGEQIAVDRSARRAVRSVSWVAGSGVVVQGLALLSGIVVARHLTPESLGALSAAQLVVGWATLTTGMGLSGPVAARWIQSAGELRTLHWMLLAIGVLLALAIAAVSGSVADFYRDARVRPLLVGASVLIPLSALSVVPSAVLQREGLFAPLARIAVWSQLATSSVAAALALLQFGVWALVASAWVGGALRAIAAGVQARPWMNGAVAVPAAMKPLGVGAKLLLVDIGDYAFRNADTAIVGRSFGTDALGLYAFAYSLFIRPLNLVTGSVGQVLLSDLAELRTLPERFDQRAVKAARGVGRIAFPLLLGAAAVAPLAIPTVFGAKWSGAVPIARLFFLLGVVDSVGALLGPIWMAAGRSRLLVAWSMVGNGSMVAAYGVGAALGSPFAVAAVALTFSALVLTPLSFWLTRRAGLPLRGLERAIAAPLRDGLLAALSALAVLRVLEGKVSAAIALSAAIGVGAVTYLLLFWLTSRAEFKMLLGALQRQRSAGGLPAQEEPRD